MLTHLSQPRFAFRRLAVSALLWTLACPLLCTSSAHAIIKWGTSARNTSAPTGFLQDSGWQYAGFVYGGGNEQLNFANDMGWAVAPNWFLMAKHTVKPLDWPFVYDGVTYDVLETVSHPTADLTLLRVDKPFTKIAPLYTKRDETDEVVERRDINGNIIRDANGNALTERVGKEMVVIGFGGLTPNLADPIITHGDPAFGLNGRQAGWNWQGGFRELSWGVNRARSVEEDTREGKEAEYLRFTYDGPTLDNGDPNPHYSGSDEGFGAPEDSGAGIFIKDEGTWKLAGVLYGIDAEYDYDGKLFTDPRYGHDLFWGAIRDARGLYQMQYNEQNEATGFALITGKDPVPTGDYATRISTYAPWIQSVTGGNVIAAAPEPNAFALLLSGVGGVGVGALVRRARRRNTV